MKGSVLITTYNQDGFIAQALGSVLMQKVTFLLRLSLAKMPRLIKRARLFWSLQKSFLTRFTCCSESRLTPSAIASPEWAAKEVS